MSPKSIICRMPLMVAGGTIVAQCHALEMGGFSKRELRNSVMTSSESIRMFKDQLHQLAPPRFSGQEQG
jgi:hypothetical protein